MLELSGAIVVANFHLLLGEGLTSINFFPSFMESVLKVQLKIEVHVIFLLGKDLTLTVKCRLKKMLLKDEK